MPESTAIRLQLESLSACRVASNYRAVTLARSPLFSRLLIKSPSWRRGNFWTRRSRPLTNWWSHWQTAHRLRCNPIQRGFLFELNLLMQPHVTAYVIENNQNFAIFSIVFRFRPVRSNRSSTRQKQVTASTEIFTTTIVTQPTSLKRCTICSTTRDSW